MRTVTLLNTNMIPYSFLNNLPTQNFKIYANSLAYFNHQSPEKQFISLLQDFYIPIDEGLGKVLQADRRLFSIKLMPINQQEYSIGAFGECLYNEKLLDLKT
jgi:hypothetical protein